MSVVVLSRQNTKEMGLKGGRNRVAVKEGRAEGKKDGGKERRL